MTILTPRDEGLQAAPNNGQFNLDWFRARVRVPVSIAGRPQVVEWTSELVGALSIIPKPSTTGTNFSLLESELTRVTPQYVDYAATCAYRISGRYKYIYASQIIGPGDSLGRGSIP